MSKKPLTPPRTSELLQAIPLQRLFEIIGESKLSEPSSEYIHWDKLFHLTPPEGFTVQEWWVSIKRWREASFRSIPLTDLNGQSFNFLVTDVMQEALYKIDLCAAGRIGVPEEIVNPETRNQYYVSSLIEEAITSSQLEGASTTRQVAKEMLREKRPPRDRSEQMILNNYEAMRQISALKKEPLTKELILNLHGIVTRNTMDDASAAGRFRLRGEEIVVQDMDGEVYHVPPPAGELEARIDDMCAFANGAAPDYFIHPVLRSIVLHFWLAYVHPFVDGNGRTARALFYWSMLHYDFWVCEYLSISTIIKKAPVQYSRAFLYTETDENDLTYFLIYHLDVLRRSLDALDRYIQERAARLKSVEEDIKSRVFLNHRQRALVSNALRHPGKIYSVQGHMTSHGIARNTAKADLAGLVEKGLFEATKGRRTFYYQAVPNLEDRLTALNELASPTDA